MKKLFRIATVPMSLNILLKGQLRYLNQFYSVTAISGEGKDMQAVKQREEVKTNIIEMAREIAPLQDLRSLYSLYRYFKQEKPDIIHSITPKAGLLSMIAGKLAGVPIRMHTFTGLIFPTRSGLLQKVLIQMDRLLCSCATHIYPEGQGVKKDLIAYQITSKTLKVIANGNVNGIDTAYFDRNHFPKVQQQELRTQLGIQPDDFVFIFVGRLVSDKGINELVTAFKNLRHCEDEGRSNLKTPTIQPQHPAPSTPHPAPNLKAPKLLLVGPLETALDPLRPETLQEIEHNKDVISVGYQDDVRPYFTIADALVFPSYREGFPNVVLQAGAMALPSIVTNINGCNEIIQDHQNGLIIPVKDAAALEKAMRQLQDDEFLYQSLQHEARKKIVDHYEQKVVWQAILEEYRKAEHHV